VRSKNIIFINACVENERDGRTEGGRDREWRKEVEKTAGKRKLGRIIMRRRDCLCVGFVRVRLCESHQ
jgi:hypothetical protein